MKWNIHSIREENDEESHLNVSSEHSSSHTQNGCRRVSTSTEEYFFDRVDRLSGVLNDSTSIECGGRQRQRRMLRKCGGCDIRKIRLKNKRQRFSLHFGDLFTSLVETRWRWIFIAFAFLNIITMYLFGVLWWMVAFYHGDLKSQTKQNAFDEEDPCVYGLIDYGTSVLFSIEVQTTIGFGSKYPSSRCPEAVFLLIVQVVFGALLGSITLGLIFTKAARPTARSKAIIFSRNAVICKRDNNLCFLFRVADVRKSKIFAAQIRAYFLDDYITSEGELIRKYQRKLAVSVDEAGSDVILSWPLTVCHRIDSASPLFGVSALDLLRGKFEIIVSLTGTLETTSQTIEARTSYLSSEILWGHRFVPVIIKSDDDRLNYSIDYEQFEMTSPVDTPVCSGHQMLEYSSPNSPIEFIFNEFFARKHAPPTSEVAVKPGHSLNEENPPPLTANADNNHICGKRPPYTAVPLLRA